MKNFKKSILSQLDNLNNNNPKAYWKLIESLKDKDSLPLSKDDFFNHFKSLNAPQEEFKQQLLNLEQKLLLKEKESLNFNELDFNISEDEVLSAIKKLKRNKSGGFQLITNDILMAGKFQLTPSLTEILLQ
jgi:benzoyl-CoA reductase/2-hydroxyglutaryl-CoA dehydratase subunit BcrC/BadD/HgdB